MYVSTVPEAGGNSGPLAVSFCGITQKRGKGEGRRGRKDGNKQWKGEWGAMGPSYDEPNPK